MTPDATPQDAPKPPALPASGNASSPLARWSISRALTSLGMVGGERRASRGRRQTHGDRGES